MNCGISKYSVSACHLKHITRKEDIKIICKDDLKLLQQRIGKSSLHLFIVNENEFTTIMYKKYSTSADWLHLICCIYLIDTVEFKMKII